MSHVAHWQTVLSRISPAEVPSLDDMLAPFTPRARTGGGPAWPAVAALSLAPALKAGAADVVGTRVTGEEDEESLVIRASMLAAMAIEHGVSIVVLSHVPYSGLERFGFRVERIVGDTPGERAACEAQVMAFWGIELMI